MRELARARTETLEGYIDRLTTDAKMKEQFMKPIRVVREHSVSCKSESFFHFVVFDMPKDLTKHLIEKATNKKQMKKLNETIQREREQNETYFAFLRSQNRRLTM